MKDMQSYSEIFVCPNCHRYLKFDQNKLECTQCNYFFSKNKYGFIEFVLDKSLYSIDSVTEEYATIQKSCGERIYEEYLKSFLSQEPFKRVLDVGCGMGIGISNLIEEGYDAYGIDLPHLSRFWYHAKNDPKHFLCCDANKLPFPDDFFDVIYSLGVIEHIGTELGHCTLSSNFWEVRQQYANEILRVTKPKGRILITCPNKRFPLDFQHGPTDALSPKTRMRSFIFDKTGVNIHPIWGKHHLLSYSELKRLFCDNGGGRYIEALPLKNYFGFGRFKSRFLKSFAAAYISCLPKFLLSSFLNPYVLVQIKK